jgi:hypothetical protein
MEEPIQSTWYTISLEQLQTLFKTMSNRMQGNQEVVALDDRYYIMIIILN